MISRSPGTLWRSNILTIWTPSEEKIASSIFIQWETYQLELCTFVPTFGCSKYWSVLYLIIFRGTEGHESILIKQLFVLVTNNYCIHFHGILLYQSLFAKSDLGCCEKFRQRNNESFLDKLILSEMFLRKNIKYLD